MSEHVRNIPAIVDKDGRETPIFQVEIDKLLYDIAAGNTEPEPVEVDGTSVHGILIRNRNKLNPDNRV